MRPAGKAWVARYQKHIATATSVIVAGDEITDGEAYRFSNRMTIGLARARARRVDGEVRGLALWDGTSGKAGGTGSAIANWRAAGVPVTVIDPLTGTARPLKGARTNFDDAPTPKYGQRETVALLFADVTGFTALAESLDPDLIARLLNEYLEGMSEIVFAHGGAFVEGQKDRTEEIHANVGWYFTRNGVAFVNIEYRLAPAHPYPSAVEDVGAAVAALKAQGVEFVESTQLHPEDRGALTRSVLGSVAFELVHL